MIPGEVVDFTNESEGMMKLRVARKFCDYLPESFTGIAELVIREYKHMGKLWKGETKVVR